MNWRELKENGHTALAGAVSGGLDSCTVTHWLTAKGFDVRCYTVDLAQPDEESLDAIAQRMVACGASSAELVDGREALAEAGLKVLQSQARYEGGYWNTTGIARPITVRAILPRIESEGAGVLFHGATGRGNDQVRFQLAANTLAPGLDVYAPWRDQEFVEEFPGRAQMVEYCLANDLPIKPPSEATYSTDANFLGLTHEAGDLEDVGKPPGFVEPGMGVWPWDAPSTPEVAAVRWEAGVPVALNGREMGLFDIFEEANRVAGAHGVGIGSHVVENRFVGVKSRGIYEAPGMELLGRTHEYLLQFILDRRARQLFDQLSTVISQQIYQGYWLDLGDDGRAGRAGADQQARHGHHRRASLSGRRLLRDGRGHPRGDAALAVHGRLVDGGDGDLRPRRRRGVPEGPGHIGKKCRRAAVRPLRPLGLDCRSFGVPEHLTSTGAWLR